MYSYEEKKRAIELYIQYGHRVKQVIRELGYPSTQALLQWYADYNKNSSIKGNYTRKLKFTDIQRRDAVEFCVEHGCNVSFSVQQLGYPSRGTLRKWLDEDYPGKKSHCQSGGAMVEYPQEKKQQAVIDFCSRMVSAQSIAQKHGVTRRTLYDWKDQLLSKEDSCRMPKEKKVARPEINSCQIASLNNAISELEMRKLELETLNSDLQRKVYQLQLEKDILEKAAEIIKKDPGINLKFLTNREKAGLIDTLREKYRLKELLTALRISKSSYCYQETCLKREDPLAELRRKICEIFYDSNCCYGYRRIHITLKNTGFIVSEKVVRRIMKEASLAIPAVRKKKYSSYAGEITPAVENIINRDFHAELPNQKWLTDITEFGLPDGKVYLSPIIDCFDGLAVSWAIGKSPNADLVNTMLETAIGRLKITEKPTVHSDRGAHYRWPGWIDRMNKAGLTRSMSKKGCSPDNSACEGFFGRLKNEMFYGRDWHGVTSDDFIVRLDRYIRWYNEKRIKVSLGGMSPIEYRESLGLLNG